jgi:hypothetical protein
MTDTHLPLQFVKSIREHLESNLRLGVLEGFSCTLWQKEIHTASLFNGEKHSKAPLQTNSPFDLQVTLMLPAERSVGFSIEATSMPMFVNQFEFALSHSVELEHRVGLRKQTQYPDFKLATDELIQLFDSGTVSTVLIEILQLLEGHAEKIHHPRLMNRELSVTFSRCDKIYFDSANNYAQEISASCSASCAFSLEDTVESHHDVFGNIPAENELASIVELAAKNITRSAVMPLGADAGLPVYLTHKAVIDLLDQLVMPNLETRSLIDKTGAWELDKVGQVVVGGLSIEDNPHVEGSPFSSYFDFEGTATKPVKILSQGRLVHPLMTSALLDEVLEIHPDWRGRFDLTGHAEGVNSTSFTNVFFHLDAPPLADLKEETYIQIQNLTGMSLDPLTGQFALDADGAKVFERGKLKYSTSLTLRGNFFQALIDKSTRVGPLARQFNQWAPAIYTRALSCVSKELAQTFEE